MEAAAAGIGGQPCSGGGFDAGDESGHENEGEGDLAEEAGEVAGGGGGLWRGNKSANANSPESKCEERGGKGAEDRGEAAGSEGVEGEGWGSAGSYGPHEVEAEHFSAAAAGEVSCLPLAEDAGGGHDEAEAEAVEEESDVDGAGGGELQGDAGEGGCKSAEGDANAEMGTGRAGKDERAEGGADPGEEEEPAGLLVVEVEAEEEGGEDGAGKGYANAGEREAEVEGDGFSEGGVWHGWTCGVIHPRVDDETVETPEHPPSLRLFCTDGVGEGADTLDFDGDVFAGAEPALGFAACADAGGSAGGDDVAGFQGHDAGEVFDQVAGFEDQFAGVGVLEGFAVDGEADGEFVGVGHVVFSDDAWAHGAEGVELLPKDH